MEEIVIARRYAKGVLNLVEDNRKVEEYITSLRSFWKDFQERVPVNILKSFNLLGVEKRWDFLKPFVKGYDRTLRRFIYVINENGRIFLLPLIADEMERMMWKRRDIALVEVVSASKLDTDILMDLTGMLSAKLGKRVRLKETIEASVVGGMLIRYDDIVVDGTVVGRLNRLRKEVYGYKG